MPVRSTSALFKSKNSIEILPTKSKTRKKYINSFFVLKHMYFLHFLIHLSCLFLITSSSSNPMREKCTNRELFLVRIFRRLLPKNCLSVFDHFVGLTLKGLRHSNQIVVIFSVVNVFGFLKTLQ